MTINNDYDPILFYNYLDIVYKKKKQFHNFLLFYV